jgi:hypothetical protein
MTELERQAVPFTVPNSWHRRAMPDYFSKPLRVEELVRALRASLPLTKGHGVKSINDSNDIEDD